MKTTNKVYKNRILKIISRIKFGTPERVRKEYIKEYLKPINWITIRRHLDILEEEGLLTRQIISEGKLRKIVIYKVN